MRQATDEAVQVGPVQIPEQEPRHSASVTEAGCGFELRKCQVSFEFRVSSFKFPAAIQLGAPPLSPSLGDRVGMTWSEIVPTLSPKAGEKDGAPMSEKPGQAEGVGHAL